jgi:hypothetical protein
MWKRKASGADIKKNLKWRLNQNKTENDSFGYKKT